MATRHGVQSVEWNEPCTLSDTREKRRGQGCEATLVNLVILTVLGRGVHKAIPYIASDSGVGLSTRNGSLTHTAED